MTSKIDWSDYPAPWSPETIQEATQVEETVKPITFFLLGSIQAEMHKNFLERQAARDKDEIAFRNAFTKWLNDCALKTAWSGFSSGRHTFPVAMGEFHGAHELYKYVKGWSVTVNGQRRYDKRRWRGGKTPFEKVVEEFKEARIHVHNVSTFHSLIVIIEW